MILGLLAGFIASKIVNSTASGPLLDILLGVFGSIFGGWLFHFLGDPGVSGLTLYSLFCGHHRIDVLLLVYHAIRRLGSQ